MDEKKKKKKKIIIITSIILGITIALGLSITWLVFTCLNWNDNLTASVMSLIGWFYNNFGSMILGIIVKILVGSKLKKDNINDLNNFLKQSGIKPIEEIKSSVRVSKNEFKDYMHTNGYHFKVSDNKVLIIYTPESIKRKQYVAMCKALGEFMEKYRKEYDVD